MKGLIGRKIGMTQIFDSKGNAIPVTIVAAGPNFVVQKKTTDTDGYDAIQIGYEQKEKNTAKKSGKMKRPKVTRPEAGHFKKAGLPALKHVKEFRVDDVNSYEVGQELKVESVFKLNDYIDVTGTTKGRGFAGTIKKYGFGRGPETHGSRNHRAPGSVGMCADPAEILKGQKMPGQYGNIKKTVQSLQIVYMDAEKNLIGIKGSIPGNRKGIVYIKKAVKK